MRSSIVTSKKLWRNDITGLRAIAVIPVLLFHAFPELIPGGFFGVDVFFVISGYLISGIIFKEFLNNTFSYRVFYEKRIRRIVPNLLLLLMSVSFVGYLFLLPDEYINLGKHIYSSAAFYQNFRLLDEVGYFTEDALRKPLIHLWSLAIEEQFYIVFPIICWSIWHFTRSKKNIGLAVFSITFSSLILCFLTQDVNFNFYFPFNRFWELGAGINLAYLEIFCSFDTKTVPKGFRNFLSVTGLGAILTPMFLGTGEMVHPGWITLFPVLGSLLLILAKPDAIVNRKLLSWRPMTFIGLISYSLYLWHWPLLSYLFICVPESYTISKLIALGLSFVLSTIIYLLIENPIRRCEKIGNFSTSLLLFIGLIFIAIMGQSIKYTQGLPNRYGSPLLNTVNSIRAVGEWDAFNEAQKIEYHGIEISTPDKSSFPTIIFAGDSHAVQYYLRADYLSKVNGLNVGFIGRGGCFVFSPESGCSKEFHAIKKLISDERVKTLVIGNIWGYWSRKAYFNSAVETLKKALLKRPDLKVYVLLDYPWTPPRINNQQGEYDPMRHINRLKINERDFIVPYPEDESWNNGNKRIVELLADFVTFIPVESYICPERQCNLLKWYRDDDHLQPMRLKEEACWLDQVFENHNLIRK